MATQPKRLRARIALGLALLLIGAAGAMAIWAPWRERGADGSFDTAVARPALEEKRPSVLFDEGHFNTHSLSGRFAPFAGLIRSDGCRVRAVRSPLTARMLAGHDILVIINASGPEQDRAASAFSSEEIKAISGWVASGGSLLLAADHHPYGAAAAALAQAFGVRMMGGWCDDEANGFPGMTDPGAIAFTRAKGMLGEHPILSGAGGAEPLGTVVTFTGQSLVAPPEAAALLICASTAVDRVPTGAKTVTTEGVTTKTYETSDTSAAGHCQGLALTFGKGRVVVLGEAAMLSAQIDARSGLGFGMNAPGVDNRLFVLNIVRWLVGVPD